MIQVHIQGLRKYFNSEAISSMIYNKIKETAEAHSGAKYIDAVITVPGHFTWYQNRAIKYACEASGLKIMHILSEPIAAAIAYGLHVEGRGKRNILVYDMGGGTLDVSLLSTSGAHDLSGFGLKVKAVASHVHLSGERIDDLFWDFCIGEFNRQNPGNEFSDAPLALWRLRQQCEHAKRTLSHSMQASIEVNSLCNGIDFDCAVSRSQFERISGTHFQESVSEIDSFLRDAGIHKKDVHEVLLVGGCAYIPKLQSMIREFFDGNEICMSVKPDEVVAYGAAVQAEFFAGSKISISKNARRLQSIGMLLETRGNTVIGKLSAEGLSFEGYFTSCGSVTNIPVLQGNLELVFGPPNRDMLLRYASPPQYIKLVK